MYKRIPSSYFISFIDVYIAMIDFMQECGFTVVNADSRHLFFNIPTLIASYVLKDPNTSHYLCLSLFDNDNDPSDMYADPRISLFIFDDYDSSKSIYDQTHIAMSKSYDWFNKSAIGVEIGAYAMNSRGDLICNYINKSLMFAYVPTNCYIYSHIYDLRKSRGGYMLFYGNFTKYHLGYDREVILCFGGRGNAYFVDTTDSGYIMASYGRSTHFGDTSTGASELGCLVYCHPEASNSKGNNFWFSAELFEDIFKTPTDPPAVGVSFGSKVNTMCEIPDYSNLLFHTKERGKTMLCNTLNNASVLLPLVVFGEREPKKIFNWSAIGESKLVNMIDMSHMSSGEIIIDNGVNKDFHKYFVFPALYDNLGITFYDPDSEEPVDYNKDRNYFFSGIAIEIWSKEDILREQSDDYLTITLTDIYRNFDRIVIGYNDKEVEWSYDELNSLYDTDGIFNLTKDDDAKCMVYGLKNEEGDSREYRFTCSEGCKINYIIGYRE